MLVFLHSLDLSSLALILWLLCISSIFSTCYGRCRFHTTVAYSSVDLIKDSYVLHHFLAEVWKGHFHICHQDTFSLLFIYRIFWWCMLLTTPCHISSYYCFLVCNPSQDFYTNQVLKLFFYWIPCAIYDSIHIILFVLSGFFMYVSCLNGLLFYN